MKKLFKENQKAILFYLLFGAYLIIIDFANRALITDNYYFSFEAIIFNITIVLVIFAFIYILPTKTKKIVCLTLNIFLLLFTITNYFMNHYLQTIFSWKDLILSRDGLSFINSIFKYINLKIILFIIISIIFIYFIYKYNFNKKYKFKSVSTIIIITIILLSIVGYKLNSKRLSNGSDGWNSTAVYSNKSNYYMNWIEPKKLIGISGTYNYIFRDFYINFLKKDNVSNASAYVKNYIENYQNNSNKNNYKDLYKNKNLIMIMMESMDDWMISEKSTPTIYEMMKHGFNFTNHYSPDYITGKTVNTEFIANTGVYPVINGWAPEYAYINNSYDYSLANLFKANGYEANSFHRSNGFIYNRATMHVSLGFSKYHNYSDMNIPEDKLDLDSYIAINGYNEIVSNNKFMSFIITYSPHEPYSYSKIECENNLKEIKNLYPDITQEQEICALSSARETDNMFKLLLEKLEKDDLLNDTIIVAFSDHPNTLYNSDLDKTVFFIYDKNLNQNNVNTITSTINILPTITNLFGLDNNFVYPGYDALNYNNGYVLFRNYTMYDGKSIKNLSKDFQNQFEFSKNLLISDYYK